MSEFTVIDHDRENERTADTRSEAEDMAATAREFGSENVEIIPPGGDTSEWHPAEECPNCGAICEHGGCPECHVGGQPTEAETDGGDVEVLDADHEPEAIPPEEVDRLPDDRNVGQDPLKWMPGEFVDTIDGTQSINRKGFEVLSHFYDVDVSADLEVAPEETDHEYARVKATAEMDGREVEAFGSAHVDRGDDHFLLLELADTRARKRALSIITGAGAVAVDELQNEPEGR